MKLNEYLNFYGIRSQEFCKEDREWSTSTPTANIWRELRKYHTAVGVDFYNLDRQDEKELMEFFRKNMGDPSTGEADELITWMMLYAPQENYKDILDKAIAGEEMTEDEIKAIDQARSGGGTFTYDNQKSGSTYQEYVKEKNRYELKTGANFGEAISPFGIIKVIYEFVIDVSNQLVQVGRCELEGCDRIFMIGSGRYTKRYCSGTHRVRAYRQREAIEAASKG